MPDMASCEIEVLSISDGTALELCRLPALDDAMWAEVKAYVARNPETAKAMQGFARNPEAMQGWLQMRAAAEHYQIALDRDLELHNLIEALEADEELAPVFMDLRKNGMEAAMKYSDEALMLKISKKLREYLGQWEAILRKLEQMTYPLHQVAKEGDSRLLQLLLKRRENREEPVDYQDSKGITALGYAIWAGHLEATKLLIEHGADALLVDSFDNTCVHYAAGYGHAELLEYLLEFGFSMHRTNAAGLTPMAVAMQSNQEATILVLDTFGTV